MFRDDSRNFFVDNLSSVLTVRLCKTVSLSGRIVVANVWQFFAHAEPYIRKALTREVVIRALSRVLQPRLETFGAIPEQIAFIEQVPDYSADLYINKKMKTDEEISKQALGYAAAALEQTEEWNNDNLFAVLKHVAEEKGLKNGQIMYPVRIALSGKETTPGGATELAVILGKTETLKRLHQAQQKLS